ncbi:hypothetical protein EDD85DRAFT_857696 [Armillaria nabsnona]|nr:hypothetical protein EDD85DRAFT_857696 [Armillaria nabsnona]
MFPPRHPQFRRFSRTDKRCALMRLVNYYVLFILIFSCRFFEKKLSLHLFYLVPSTSALFRQHSAVIGACHCASPVSSFFFLLTLTFAEDLCR